MASYSELNSRPASAFLNSEAFRTGYDTDEGRREERYRKELERCKGYVSFSVGVNGTWGAVSKDGGHISSYEGIGYHAYTADLLRAVLDSDCAFTVYRWENDSIVEYDVRALQTVLHCERNPQTCEGCVDCSCFN